MNKAKTGLTVKRSITVKAILTEKLRKDMSATVQQALDNNKSQIRKIEQKIKEVTSVVFDGQIVPGNNIHQQLEAEKQKVVAQNKELENQMAMIQALKLGDEVQHQPLEGMVQIEEGDNLYEKIQGIEVIIRDGIIEKISKRL